LTKKRRKGVTKMFRVIFKKNGIEQQVDRYFETELEAETYAEGVGFAEFKVIPVIA
jgi:hypothetical protein